MKTLIQSSIWRNVFLPRVLLHILFVLLFCALAETHVGSFHSTMHTSSRPELVLQRGHSQGVTCAAFAPDGTWLASGAADNTILIWQLPSGRQLRTLSGHRGPIRSLAISVNGELLASGSNDRTIKIWNIAKGTETFTLTGHTGSINSLSF